MIRKRESEFGRSVRAKTICRPEESVLLVETGGKDLKPADSVGFSDTVELSTPLFMTSSFQYDNMLWGKDFYTFNQQNSLVGLLILCWNERGDKKYRFVLYPMVLPFINLTLNNDADPETFTKLQEHLAYALNLQFDPGRQNVGGWCLSRISWERFDVNEHWCPIFQNNKLPPLQWKVYDGRLVLFRNDEVYHGEYAFNLISMHYEWFNEKNYYNRTDGRFYSNNPATRPLMNSSMFGNEKGWFGRGPDVFGYGQFDNVNKRYVDDYGSEYAATFTAVTWNGDAGHNPIPTRQFNNSEQFRSFCRKHKLHENMMIGPRIINLLPTRFYTIHSKALCSTSTALVIANNPSISNVVDVKFNFKDSNSNRLVDERPGFSKLFHGLSPVTNIEKLRARNVIDLGICDEYDNYVKNFDNNENRNDDNYWYSCHWGNIKNVPLSPYFAWNPDPVINPDGNSPFVLGIMGQRFMWGNTLHEALKRDKHSATTLI